MTAEQKETLEQTLNQYTISNYFFPKKEFQDKIQEWDSGERTDESSTKSSIEKSPEEFSAWLKELEQLATKRKEEAEALREQDYQKACEMMDSCSANPEAETIQEQVTKEAFFVGENNPYLEAANLFHSIGAYKDCRNKEKECRDKYSAIEQDISFNTYRKRDKKNTKSTRIRLIILAIIFIILMAVLIIPAIQYWYFTDEKYLPLPYNYMG